MPNSEPVAEIVMFRLLPDTNEADFVNAAAAVETKLTQSGQMLARTLCKGADEVWTDHIVWTNDIAAKAAAEEVMQSVDCAPMMSMIDPEGVEMRHGVILRRMD